MSSSYIVLIHRKDQTLTREVTADSFSVGRSVDCDISLSDNQISRVHLTVSCQGNELLIEDRNSSNGTFVNDEKITPGVAIVVSPADRIQLGNSEYSLFIELKIEPVIEEAPPVFEEEPELEPTMAMPPPQMSPLQAEKIIHEAKRQAAQIVLEGETQAEKRVQAIYQKARADQAQAEQYYQNRLSEANKEADRIMEEYKKQGQTLLQDARRMSQEMREEVDHYVQTLREKAKKDAEVLMQESQAQADRVRAETFAQTREDARKESNEIIQGAKEEAQRLVEFTRLQTKDLEERLAQDTQSFNLLSQQLKDTQENLSKAMAELEDTSSKNAELKAEVCANETRIAQILQDEKDRIDELLRHEREEIEKYLTEKKQASEEIIREQNKKVQEAIQLEETRISELLRNEEERVAQIISHEESRVANLVAEEKERIEELLNRESAKISELRNEEADLLRSKESLTKTIEEHQLKQGRVIADLGDLEKKFLQLSKDYEAEKIRYAEKTALDLSQQKKSADERRNTYELELNKNLQQMEKKMLDAILTKKQELIQNIHSSLEQELVKVVPQEKWGPVSSTLKELVSESFEGRMATLAQESSSVKSIDKLVAQKRNEKIRWVTMGFAVGMLALFVGQTVLVKMRADQSPLQSMTLQAAQKRQEDLEARKFNPAQTSEVRESFTDSVIYTSNFASIYTDPVYQEKMYKAASQYLLKTWRVDEDKSIQVLAIATALVKDLADRRSKIHPDFVKEGIDKMKAAESESLLRMKDILGTEVRVESFRRFDRNFYTQELKNRKMAHH
ncbi:large Ala/Glu-rich protein [Bdellovibrio bacteriovorus W]|nr:large Ala/Glu-rich protein [Bdellovibrio bacteriovorus W]